MDERREHADEERVRKKIRQFMTDRRKKFRGALIERLSRVKGAGFSAWTLGGFPRDLVASGRAPRDIDIVVDGIDPEEAVRVFGGEIVRVTRFGGVHARIGSWPIDIWSLNQTWAFREGLVRCRGIEDLPKTTSFNIEAIAVELFPQPGQRGRRVVEYGFFDAVQRRLIDINLEDNPFPELCVVRALVFSNRLRFSIAPRLVTYLSHHLSRVDVDELVDVQLKHYGRVLMDQDILASWYREIRHHALRWPMLAMDPLPYQEELYRAQYAGSIASSK